MTGREGLRVSFNGRSLHIVASDGRALCGRHADVRDLYASRAAGWRVWSSLAFTRCGQCERALDRQHPQQDAPARILARTTDHEETAHDQQHR